MRYGPERLQCSGPRPLASTVLLYTFMLDLPCEFVLLTAFGKL